MLSAFVNVGAELLPLSFSVRNKEFVQGKEQLCEAIWCGVVGWWYAGVCRMS